MDRHTTAPKHIPTFTDADGSKHGCKDCMWRKNRKDEFGDSPCAECYGFSEWQEKLSAAFEEWLQ